jgi:hypothetical protein
MDAVPTVAETLAAAQVAALDALAAELATYSEANYTAEGWTALNNAQTDGDTAIQAATDLAGVAAALDAAVAAMDAVPTFAETLAADKAAALDDLAAALAAYLEENYYTHENWEALIAAQADGEAAIHAATDAEGVAAALEDALAAMDAIPTIAETSAAPVITDISRIADGEVGPTEGEAGTSIGDVTIMVATTPTVPLTLETSTDLQSWTPIATATPDTASWSFVHEAAQATGPMRFYRVLHDPLGDPI